MTPASFSRLPRSCIYGSQFFWCGQSRTCRYASLYFCRGRRVWCGRYISSREQFNASGCQIIKVQFLSCLVPRHLLACPSHTGRRRISPSGPELPSGRFSLRHGELTGDGSPHVNCLLRASAQRCYRTPATALSNRGTGTSPAVRLINFQRGLVTTDVIRRR